MAVLLATPAGHERAVQAHGADGSAMGLVDMAVQSVDGAKVLANASRVRSYTADQLGRILDQLERAIEEREERSLRPAPRRSWPTGKNYGSR